MAAAGTHQAELSLPAGIDWPLLREVERFFWDHVSAGRPASGYVDGFWSRVGVECGDDAVEAATVDEVVGELQDPDTAVSVRVVVYERADVRARVVMEAMHPSSVTFRGADETEAAGWAAALQQLLDRRADAPVPEAPDVPAAEAAPDAPATTEETDVSGPGEPDLIAAEAPVPDVPAGDRSLLARAIGNPWYVHVAVVLFFVILISFSTAVQR